ncbi:Tetratricopeptide repeat protein 4 [Schistosoma japonicum]|nr:Tetratricopeptide repeat protein 4 [Schistosoma japonicum]KAH8866851.1 Tetratricopeptide repeat protein 4 [Schistosoma japonicum]
MSVTKNSPSRKENSNDGSDWDDILNHPAFATEIDPALGLHPATAALQALKYESDDPDTNALSYKDEGNYYYKRKELSKAITSYTAGLRAKSSDSKLNSILYSNRALCHFYLKNYRSCIRDCKSAVALSPDYAKAYIKGLKCTKINNLILGIEACLALSKFDEALELSSAGLTILPSSSELLDAQYKILRKQMEVSKEIEHKSKVDCKKEDDVSVDYEILKSRGIIVNLTSDPIDMPETSCSKFYVDSLGKFHWPILFMYPEFGQTDFLRDVIESSTISDCLKILFDVNQPPPSWDPDHLYSSEDDAIEVYFKHDKMRKFIVCPPKLAVKKLTKINGFCVCRDLIIILYIVSKRSVHFYTNWKDEVT